MTQPRAAAIQRDTKETRISAEVLLDGGGRFDGGTGIEFLDHMLDALARHSGVDIMLRAEGDLGVDCHHTVEDAGIVLGEAIRKAAGDKAGIGRYGHAVVPMEEALCECSLDFCGRPYLFFSADFQRPLIGEYATEVTEDFFRAFCNHAGMTMHLEARRGRNAHHIVEGLFKAFARALRASLARTGGDAVPSTKGVL